MSNVGHRKPLQAPLVEFCRQNRNRPGWFREQLDSFADHVRSSPPYNQDQLARALSGIAEGREWEAMVWR